MRLNAWMTLGFAATVFLFFGGNRSGFVGVLPAPAATPTPSYAFGIGRAGNCDHSSWVSEGACVNLNACKQAVSSATPPADKVCTGHAGSTVVLYRCVATINWGSYAPTQVGTTGVTCPRPTTTTFAPGLAPRVSPNRRW